MKKIVITGGIASGKSLVSQMARQRGLTVIDADQVARMVVQLDSRGWHALVKEFGADYFDEHGNMDRSRLRSLIARDSTAQKRIGEILHPLIVSDIQSQLSELEQQGAACAFVEAALTIESGSYRHYDVVLLVTASDDIRQKRVMARDGMSIEDVKALISRQMPEREKRHFAHYILENNGTKGDLESKFSEFLVFLGID